MSKCPTPCDDDCEINCHEEHLVTWKRDPGHTHDDHPAPTA